MHITYRDMLLSRVQAAVASAAAVSTVPHQALKGQFREIVIRDLLRPLLPTSFGVGTGEIISSDGRTSTQQDIVIYDRDILPPILLEGETGLFPIESAIFAIEVKSTLTADALRESHIKAKELSQFPCLPGNLDEPDSPGWHRFLAVNSSVFAFGSDLTLGGKTEVERYDEIHASDSPYIKAICVVGRGCWTWLPHKNAWLPAPGRYVLEEIVCYLAMLLNSYRRIRDSRLSPRLGEYLIPPFSTGLLGGALHRETGT